MASTYSNLGIELIGTGEQAGTWGITTNSNLNAIIDNAIVGYRAVAITGTSSGAPTVLTISDGSASDGQKRILEATGSPASAGFLQISPNDFAGYYFIRNSTTQTLNVFQGTYSSGNAVTIESGYDAIIRCDGGGAGAIVSFINYNIKTGPIFATNSASVGSVIQGSTSSAALRVTQTGTGNSLLVEDTANPDSTPFVIDASGRVIIGATTSDATTLTADSAFQISSVSGTFATANFICWSATTSVPPQLQFNKSNSGVIGTRGVVASGDALGYYTFSGDNGTSFVRAAQIGAFVDGAVAAGSMPGRIIFYTSPSGSVSPTERLRIDSAGGVTLGSGGAPAGTNFYNIKTLTGATTAVANYTNTTVQSDVTSDARGYTSLMATAAAAFTLTALRHFYANQSTIGAGSAVTTQWGFIAGSSLIGATNNYGFSAGDTAAVTAGKTAYGFYSSVNTATGGGTTYAFYGAGTAPSVFNGTVNMGSTGSAGSNFYNAQNITGSTVANANAVSTNVQSDVTSQARGYHSSLGTAAAVFTLSNLYHHSTQQGTIGAGSTVSNQYGFHAASTLIGATINYGFFATDTAAVTAGKTAYGFYSGVNTATGGGTTYAFYANGTAPSVFTGNVSIGTTGSSARVTARSDSSGAVSDVMLLQNNTPTTINTGVALYFDPNGSGTSRAASVQSVQSTSGNYADLRFFTANATTPAERMRISAAGNVGVSQTSPTSNLDVNGSIAFRAPSLVNAATYATATTDVSLRFTTTACVVTLPAAASFSGRILYLNNVTAIAVTSSATNVIPLGSNTAGTAILAATAGKFAMIQSDGTNWITMMAN